MFTINRRGLVSQILLLFAIVALAATAAVPAVLAGEINKDILVTYKGQKVSYKKLLAEGTPVCHDAAGPGQLTCFDSEEEMNQSSENAGTNTDAVVPAQSGTPYIKLYEHIDGGGSWIQLAYDYNSLGSIGWSNRASSLEVYAGKQARLCDYTNYGGSCISYPGSTDLFTHYWPWLGDWNDRISSVYRSK